jgi:probable rRNA maturation factor
MSDTRKRTRSAVLIDSAARRHPVLPLSPSELHPLLQRILQAAHLGDFGVELRITSDQGSTDVHQRHLGGVGPTNVLSFPEDAPEAPGNAMLGCILLNADAVLREACLYQQTPAAHFTRLLTHALLHLAGVQHGEFMELTTESIVAHMEGTP